MSLNSFLQKVTNDQDISFDATIAVITKFYDYEPTEFYNGLGSDKLINKAGTNEGSCKIFSFAQLNQLSQQHTLNLFGDYYKKDVLDTPVGSNHQNIRQFMKHDWEGISFTKPALTAKN